MRYGLVYLVLAAEHNLCLLHLSEPFSQLHQLKLSHLTYRPTGADAADGFVGSPYARFVLSRPNGPPSSPYRDTASLSAVGEWL